MVIDENYIKGALWQPVKVEKADLEKADQVIDSEAVSFHVTGQVMYVGTIDHQISQIIFQGKKILLYMIQQIFSFTIRLI